VTGSNEHDNGRIFEFEHGGTSPIAILDDSHWFIGACAIDPKTGDLAVTGVDFRGRQTGHYLLPACAGKAREADELLR
jgi:hypothetical protein